MDLKAVYLLFVVQWIRQNVVCSLDRLRFTKNYPEPCWSLSVVLEKMDGSAAPMPGILIQSTAFPYPAIALTSQSHQE